MTEKQPIELPATLKGTAVLGKAKDLFSKNLILCVPRLVGLIIVFGISFIGGIMMAFTIMSAHIGSAEEATKLGLWVGSVLGVSIGIIITPVYVFVEGWLIAASVEMFQTGRARLTGLPTETVSKRSGQLITAAFLSILLAAPATMWVLNWILTSPPEVVIQSASFYENYLIGPIKVVVGTFLTFFIALIVAANGSAINSLVRSISIMTRMIRDDASFFLCILGYNLLNWLAGLMPTIGWILTLILDLFVAPIIVISVLVYLKVLPKEQLEERK